MKILAKMREIETQSRKGLESEELFHVER